MNRIPTTLQDMTTTKRKASSTYLEPGQDSIDRNSVTTATINGQPVKVLRWNARFADGDLKSFRTQGTSRDSAGDIRRRARAKLAEEIAKRSAGVERTSWTLRSSITDYLEQVSAERVRTATTAKGEPLRQNTIRQYERSLALLADAWKGKRVGQVVKFSALESTLEQIARERGSETSRQVRNVLSRFVLDRLRRDGVIDRATATQLKGERLDIAPVNKSTAKITHGKALTRVQWLAVVEWLLSVDPEQVERSPRGRYGLEASIAKRANSVDLTLLQAATGLRVAEALALRWSDLEVAKDGTMFVTVRPEVSKTHEGRRVPVQHPDVQDRMIARQNASSDLGGYVFGSPVDPARPWENRNAHRVLEALYGEVAEALAIPELADMRSHSWRTTLNSLHSETLSAERRSALFGHSREVNAKHYLDVSDVTAVVESARRLRAV